MLAALKRFAVVVVQHEFGVFGGPDGDEIILFLEECPIPAVCAPPAPESSRRHPSLRNAGRLGSTNTSMV